MITQFEVAIFDIPKVNCICCQRLELSAGKIYELIIAK